MNSGLVGKYKIKSILSKFRFYNSWFSPLLGYMTCYQQNVLGVKLVLVLRKREW